MVDYLVNFPHMLLTTNHNFVTILANKLNLSDILSTDWLALLLVFSIKDLL